MSELAYTKGLLLRVYPDRILSAGYGWRGVVAVLAHEMVHWLHFLGLLICLLSMVLVVVFFCRGNYIVALTILVYTASSIFARAKVEYDELIAHLAGAIVYPDMAREALRHCFFGTEYSWAKKVIGQVIDLQKMTNKV